MSLLKNQVIRYSDLDMKFIDEVIECGSKIFGKDDANTIRCCIQCGTCTASCPSGRRTSLRTREIFRDTQLGFKEHVLANDDLWACTTCYTCQERCPRGVKTTDIIRTLRNLAVKEGHMIPEHQAVAGYLIKTGHAVPINEKTKKLRVKLGLSEIPPTTHKFAKSLVDVKTLVRKLGFDRLVGFKEDKK
jgi:heterodisulfide reductase subunit C